MKLMDMDATIINEFKRTSGSGKLTRRRVILIAAKAGTDCKTVVKRLEQLKLAKDGSWRWFVVNGGITERQIRQVLDEEEFKNQSES